MKAGTATTVTEMEGVDARARVLALYRLHRDDVYRLALRYARGNPDWAEDVTQDVFVALCRYVDRLDELDDLGKWFYRVTHNCCLTRLRRRATWQAFLGRWSSRAAKSDDGERHIVHRVGLAELIAALDVLDPRQRLAFCMHHLDGLGQAEVAEILGCSKGQVCKLVKRATEALECAGWEVDHGG
jgi:RNA polymerase sigma factor (sigma-70 family)